MTKRALLFPAMAVPFLSGAYSRGCEYTCDRYGNALEPEAGFFVNFAEILATHPHLSRRVAALNSVRRLQPSAARVTASITEPVPAN